MAHPGQRLTARRSLILGALLTTAFVLAATGGGCQVIAGLDDLEPDPTFGQGAGGSGGSESGSCSDELMNGDETGVDCGGSCLGCDGDECQNAGDCQSGECVDDVCCATSCTECEICDAPGMEGQCEPKPDDEECGDEGYTCDGSGECRDSCSSADECGSAYFCALGGSSQNECLACDEPAGMTPTCTVGGTCDTCEGPSNELCVRDCSAATGADCTGMVQVQTMAGPVRVNCGDGCNGVMIGCGGPHPCEVVCDNPAGCNGITVTGSPDGDVELTCLGGSCSNATLNCGDKACTANCPGPETIQVDCAGSCDCTNTCD